MLVWKKQIWIEYIRITEIKHNFLWNEDIHFTHRIWWLLVDLPFRSCHPVCYQAVFLRHLFCFLCIQKLYYNKRYKHCISSAHLSNIYFDFSFRYFLQCHDFFFSFVDRKLLFSIILLIIIIIPSNQHATLAALIYPVNSFCRACRLNCAVKEGKD